MTPGARYKRVECGHAPVDAGRGKAAIKLLCPPCIGDRVRLAIFECQEMRDRFGKVFLVGESCEGGNFASIGAARVLRLKVGMLIGSNSSHEGYGHDYRRIHRCPHPRLSEVMLKS